MNIAYYMPFKPMNHANPSGDLVIGTELHDHLAARGHNLTLVSRLRCRWIYYHPLSLLRLLGERRRILHRYRQTRPDLWLSYHSYYKAPDILGASCSKRLAIPYAIFQGIYSTKRRKKLATLPGYLINRQVLRRASQVFTNKRRDLVNLQRLLPVDRISYIAPGIHPQLFSYSGSWREELRRRWQLGQETAVIAAAMMRPGVKTLGLQAVITACGELLRSGLRLRLLIAGDGSCRPQLEAEAAMLPAGQVRFLGKIPRQELYRYFSAADLFAFPGYEESLGMVYLEAQSCNLPVVACRDWGGGEAVIDGQTGLLYPAAEPAGLAANIRLLAEQPALRTQLARQAGRHIRRDHDLAHNYRLLEEKLVALTR